MGLVFRPPGLAVLAGIAAVGAVPYGGWFSWPLAVLWSVLIIRGTLAKRTDFSPIPLVKETNDLIPLWWRGIGALALVVVPIGLMFATKYGTIYFPDSKEADLAYQLSIPIAGFACLIAACFFPAALSFAATEIDAHFLLSPRLLRNRTSKVWLGLALGFPGLIALAFVGGGLHGLLPGPIASYLTRCAGFALLFLIARVIGLQLLPDRP